VLSRPICIAFSKHCRLSRNTAYAGLYIMPKLSAVTCRMVKILCGLYLGSRVVVAATTTTTTTNTTAATASIMILRTILIILIPCQCLWYCRHGIAIAKFTQFICSTADFLSFDHAS